MKPKPLLPDLLHRIDAYWRALGRADLSGKNPLLKRSLTFDDVKPMLLGHWGTTLGQNFIYAHFNRVIKEHDLDMIYVSGPGLGGRGVVGNTYLEGSYREVYPSRTARHSYKFLDTVTVGIVLFILHLNGYKIANPIVVAGITREELDQLMRGYGWTPYFVDYEGDDNAMHQAMAEALDIVVAEIQRIHLEARERGSQIRPRWPMIVLNSPKGWTGPKEVAGLHVEGPFRAHQVPLPPAKHPE